MLTENRIEETRFSFSDRVPDPPERRQQDRVVTILRVGTLIIDGRRELCLIRNISAGGLLAHVYSPVEPEQKVLVELKSNQQIEGRIAWVKDENAGIAFDVPVDITALLANPPVLPNGWRPRMPRVEVDRLATLRDGAVTHWVHIRDISQGGVKLEFEQPLEIGAEIVITPEHFGPVAGTVRWQKDRFCGVSFNQAVPFDQLIAWLKRGS
ncbi:PilZ domain-containing protein [Sphingosinicella terrae]|uniref:PilZ domain-containing protein n=1 Tax=Sphingosinicella terrae TaxID=2172047 RepID=UPI000E0D5CDC|nr:PilZ domain-containing protein [Sphingosinicella terrae]